MAREARSDSSGNEEEACGEARGGARARAFWRRLRDTHQLKRRLHIGETSIRRAAKRIYTEASIQRRTRRQVHTGMRGIVAVAEDDAPTGKDAHVIQDRDERHLLFARWIAQELVAPPAEDLRGEHVRRRIIDVAGGKGRLSAELVHLGWPCALVDPWAGSGRAPWRLGAACGDHTPSPDERTRQTQTPAPTQAQVRLEVEEDEEEDSQQPDVHEAAEIQPEIQPEVQPDVHEAAENDPCSSSDALVRIPLTFQKALESHPRIIEGTAALVGLHPDEATDHIIDVALARRLPFAVLPCCVFPLPNFTRTGASGGQVKKFGAFLRYLADKDPRIRHCKLPFKGRNHVLFMRAVDYEGGRLKALMADEPICRSLGTSVPCTAQPPCTPPPGVSRCEVRWAGKGTVLYRACLTKSVVVFALAHGDGRSSGVSSGVVDCIVRTADGWSADALVELTMALEDAAAEGRAVLAEGYPEGVAWTQGAGAITGACMHVQQLLVQGRVWRAECSRRAHGEREAEGGVAASGPLLPPLSNYPKRNDNRFPAFADFLVATFDGLDAGRGVMYVAGGSGGLAFELSIHRNVPCVIIDPREVQYAPTQRLALERNRILRGTLSPFVEVSSLAAFICEQIGSHDVSQLYARFDSRHVLAAAARMDGDRRSADWMAAADEMASVASAARECSLMVGVHADDALDHIIDVALALRKPFAVAPCCVFWKHGGNARRRALPSEVGGAYEQLCAYLASRAPGIRETTLNCQQGANRIFYWRPEFEQRSDGEAVIDGSSRSGSREARECELCDSDAVPSATMQSSSSSTTTTSSSSSTST